jgi:hypothetical protein
MTAMARARVKVLSKVIDLLTVMATSLQMVIGLSMATLIMMVTATN